MNKDMPLTVVWWTDASAVGSWLTLEDAQKYPMIECVSTGFLIKEDKNAIRLVQTVGSNDRVTDLVIIPMKWVQKVKKVKYA